MNPTRLLLVALAACGRIEFAPPGFGSDAAQQAYVKASNADPFDYFGWSVALSGDTLAIGAIGESSNASGVDGDQGDNSASQAGAVYVFVRAGASWVQQAYLKASNSGTASRFGVALALDGDTLVVGADGEPGSSTGVNGDQQNAFSPGAGAVYVFVRDGATWSQQAYVKPSNANMFQQFGAAVALDGDTLVVGAPGEESAARGVGGDQTDTSRPAAGAAYVFARSGTTWTQHAYLKASNTGGSDQFGAAVTIAGETLVVGAPGESSAAAQIDGDEADDSAGSAGAAYAFVRGGGTWAHQAYLKADDTQAGAALGHALGFADGTLAIGAPGHGGGEAYGFARDRGTWTQQTILGVPAAGGLGYAIAFDGASVVVGAPAGAGGAFVYAGAAWAARASLVPSPAPAATTFGDAVAIDGPTCAVGAPYESSGARGVDGDPDDTSATDAGAVYVFQ